jgi:hypothetical protein
LAPSMPALGFTDPAGALANATAASSFRCGLHLAGPRSSRWLDPTEVAESLGSASLLAKVCK